MYRESSYSMILKAPSGKEVNLSIINIEDLKPHENTISELLSSLITDIHTSATQKDPILVDSDSHIVLDGMHRLEALRSVGARFIVCAEYNYLDSSVRLERWLRRIDERGELALKILTGIFNLKPCASQRDAVAQVNSDKGKVAVLTGSGALISSESLEKLEAYSRMARFDKICMLEGLKVAFASESSVFDHLKSSSSLIVYPPMLTKSEILEIAKSRKLLPWKTTRHIVPLRVLGIEFPVEILKKNDEIGKIQESLSSTLQGRDIEFRLPNTIYEGREYPEPLAIFRPKKRIC
jgi:hypothetical protein